MSKVITNKKICFAQNFEDLIFENTSKCDNFFDLNNEEKGLYLEMIDALELPNKDYFEKCFY